jgi:hypothetical protein
VRWRTLRCQSSDDGVRLFDLGTADDEIDELGYAFAGFDLQNARKSGKILTDRLQ